MEENLILFTSISLEPKSVLGIYCEFNKYIM